MALSPPTNVKENERFLGVCGVYQKFISNFQVVAEPLSRLKKKDTPFVWTAEQQESFDTLEKKLAELPTLVQSNFNKPFELHCGAATSSDIGVVLCQRDDEGSVYPFAFSSRSLSKFEQKYFVRELEALSIVWVSRNIIFTLKQVILQFSLTIVRYNGYSVPIQINSLVSGVGVSFYKRIIFTSSIF